MLAVKTLPAACCLLRLRQTRVPRPDDRLRPVCHLQFGEDIADMVRDCFRGEEELPGDGRAVFPLRDQTQNLALSLGQIGKKRRGCWARKIGEHSRGDGGLKIASPRATERITRSRSSSSVPLSTYPRAPARSAA